MAKRILKIRSWDDVIQHLIDVDARYMLRRFKKSPYLQIRDKQTKKEFSLKAIRSYDNMPQVAKVADLIIDIGNKPWPDKPIEHLLQVLENPDSTPQELNYQWEDIRTFTLQHCLNQNKTIDGNVKRDLNDLVKINLPFEWQAIKSWVYEKKLKERPFRNRLDSLRQIMLALTNKYGEEPEWLTFAEYMKLRQLHNLAYQKNNKYISSDSYIRGIPTRDQLEEYLESLDKKFKLEKWAIACQANWGLRNHELFHASIIKTTNIEEGLYKGHLYIPGEWRTKSFEHWVWPLFPAWIDKFNLMDDFEEMRGQLRKRIKPKIVSAFNKEEEWVEGNPQDPGVCINNKRLGEWTMRRMKDYLPPLYGDVPDAKGLPDKKIEPQRITPYDLRHNWAIRHATDASCAGITEEQAAKAMGHSLDVHKKNYQKWVSVTEARKQSMTGISFPQ